MELLNRESTIENVQSYYGQVLSSNKDLQTTACCTADAMPLHAREVVKDIHPEILDRFYGCGSPVPHALKGKTVLDLGCGTGRDVYIFSKLVGEEGRVIGVDMTDEQLNVAKKYQAYQAEKFGHSKSNVTFKKGFIEDLKSLGVEDNSVDLVVSNCVINLSPDKRRVFSEILRILKPGGEIYFSDVFSDRRIPKTLTEDKVLLGECLSGAMYTEDFRRLMGQLGCADFRVLSKTKIDLSPGYVFEKLGMVNFYSITVRAFKLELEDRCEDYGQVAFYKGTVPGLPHEFMLDDHHILKTGQPMTVCSNTAAMLSQTRYAEHFTVVGDTKTHYGLFDCGPSADAVKVSAAPGACC